MFWQFDVFSLPVFIASAIVLAFALLVWRRHPRPDALALPALFDHVADGVIVLNVRLRVVEINTAAREMLGCPADQATGINLFPVVHPHRGNGGTQSARPGSTFQVRLPALAQWS